MKTCMVEGCERDIHARRLCGLHYTRIRANGTTEPRVLPSPTDRLAAGLIRMPNGCLEWTNRTNAKGYGEISVGGSGKKVGTHRLTWELVNGPIPDGMNVLHHCDNPPCCQTAPTEGFPEGHLFLGTKADNNADAASKGRSRNGSSAKTRCPQSHPYDEANTYRHGGRRFCRTCLNAKAARRRARQRAARAQTVSTT